MSKMEPIIVALYAGNSVATATLIHASTDPELVHYVAERMRADIEKRPRAEKNVGLKGRVHALKLAEQQVGEKEDTNAGQATDEADR